MRANAMPGHRRQVATIVAVGILVALAIGLGIYYSNPLGNSTASSVSTSSSGQPFRASNDTTLANLELQVSLNPTMMNGDEVVSINVSEISLVNHVQNVTANMSWHDDLPDGKDMPDKAYFPVNIEIFKGYYTSHNISLGNPLVFDTSARDLPCCDMTPDEYFLFSPLSSFAHVQQNPNFTNSIHCPVACLGPADLPVSYDLKLGPCCYYNSPYDTSSFALPAGTYTMKVYDMWGRVILANFAVTNPTSATTNSSSGETTLTRSTSSSSASP